MSRSIVLCLVIFIIATIPVDLGVGDSHPKLTPNSGDGTDLVNQPSEPTSRQIFCKVLG